MLTEPAIPTKRSRGRPALPREGQRQRLVDAAIRAFGRTNGEKLTVSDIVREAGMSSRTFYDHFDSKDDLVAELFMSQARRFVAELAVLAQRTPGAVARCEQGVQIFCDLFPSASTIDFERLGGDAAERVRAERRRVVNLIAETIVGEGEELYARGEISYRPNRARVELVLMGIESLSLRYYSEGRMAEFASLKPVMREMLLHAIGP
jgi:AcrR family transcriptional regulator